MQDELSEVIGAPIRVDAPLAEYTSFRIGGPARYLCIVRDAEKACRALTTARAKDLPCMLLGHGSNVLFPDGGYDGLVVSYQADRIEVHGGRIWAEGGAATMDLVTTAARHGLAGLSFAAGIPGTVGGAISGNAGAYGRAVGDLLVEAVLVSADGAKRRRATAAELDLAYRSSGLRKTGELVESVTLGLEQGDQTSEWTEIEEILAHRASRLPPPELPSAGSFFRNLPPPEPGAQRVPAGKLLDECGCRGLRVGDAAVYEGHANIVVNLGRATAREVLRLAEEMQRRVRERFGVQLRPEVRIVTRTR